MRDFIVTHAVKSTYEFIPRVIRADSATEALRATVKALHWSDRRISRSRYKQDMLDVPNFGRWYCDRNDGTWGGPWRDTLDVQPFKPSMWVYAGDIVRLDRNGRYVKHIRQATFA